jgi:mono/diheme cytochrome c family protein
MDRHMVGQTIKTIAITVVTVLVIAVVVGLAVVFTGRYDVAATEDHWGITTWALDKLQRASVASRAGVPPVPIPTDPAALDHGFEHFHAMCVQCHGAPGFDPGELGQGMNPTPPRLEEEAPEWSDGELFWITKYGIRLAGMPAFGVTHTDQEIAGIVAFIRRLEAMTEDEYAERVRALSERGSEGSDAAHSHPPGTPAHED